MRLNLPRHGPERVTQGTSQGRRVPRVRSTGAKHSSEGPQWNSHFASVIEDWGSLGYPCRELLHLCGEGNHISLASPRCRWLPRFDTAVTMPSVLRSASVGEVLRPFFGSSRSAVSTSCPRISSDGRLCFLWRSSLTVLQHKGGGAQRQFLLRAPLNHQGFAPGMASSHNMGGSTEQEMVNGAAGCRRRVP